MKKTLCAMLTIAAFTGCQGPASTDLNRPPADTEGTRHLKLLTSFNGETEEEFASASYSDGSATGFGPGIFITCNSFPIIDTRKGSYEPDTEIFIGDNSGAFDWVYNGPDTNFEVELQNSGEFEITEPSNGEEFFFTEDSLDVVYTPTGPCTSLQVILTDESGDTVRPFTPFDSVLGTIGNVWLGSSALQSGEGTITIAKVSRTSFSSLAIHSIIVEDSSLSRPSEVLWE